MNDKAKETHDNQLKELRVTAKPLLEEINQLRDNKLEQYKELKKMHDNKK